MPKSYGNLLPQIAAFSNLLVAYERARKGKQETGDMHAFSFNLEENLWQLHEELSDGSYRPGPYRSFYIYEPKKRKISAAPFRDRVVHHALCRVIQPLFERKFIYDSYANRTGKGTHAALDRAHSFVKRYPYVLKADILKFFPSVDHAILRQTLQKTIRCQPTLALCQQIIHSGKDVLSDEYPMQWFPGDTLLTPLERGRGLPIGNLTSQFWANVLLNELDHFVKENLRSPGYVRYVDDFLLFGQDKAALWQLHQQIAGYLAGLRLTLHPRKCHVMPTSQGVPFLGFRLFPTHRRLLGDSLRRARQRLRWQRQAMAHGELPPEAMRRSLASWIGHAQHGDTYYLRYLLLSKVTWRIGQPINQPAATDDATIPYF